MDQIIISSTTSDAAENAVIALIRNGFVASRAIINYNLLIGLPPINQFDQYPLILEGVFHGYPTKIHVYSVTAGYGGTGPHAMLNILKSAGFRFNEGDILTPRYADATQSINLVYHT